MVCPLGREKAKEPAPTVNPTFAEAEAIIKPAEFVAVGRFLLIAKDSWLLLSVTTPSNIAPAVAKFLPYCGSAAIPPY